MTRSYYVLLSRQAIGAPWFIEIGAYDRQDCVDELDDHNQHGIPKRNLKIIKVAAPRSGGARQVNIDAAIAKLNA